MSWQGRENAASHAIDVSIVMPCLDEVRALPAAIASARAALETLALAGLSGEIIVADNGSTDGSRRRWPKASAPASSRCSSAVTAPPWPAASTRREAATS